jgi:hypothetical protein
VWYENHAIETKDVGFYLVRDGDPGTSEYRGKDRLAREGDGESKHD